MTTTTLPALRIPTAAEPMTVVMAGDSTARGVGDLDRPPAPSYAQQSPAERTGDPVEGDGRDASDQQRSHQRGGGRVGRFGAVGQQRRPQTGAQERARHESAQAEHADDEPVSVPPCAQQQREVEAVDDAAGQGFGQ